MGAKLERIESVQTGELTSALGADTAQLRGILSQGIVEIIVQSLTLLGALVMMFVLDWVLAVVVILAVLLLVASGVLLGSRTRPAAEAVQDAVGEMSASFGRVLGGIRTVKAFAGEQFPFRSQQIRRAAVACEWLN
nr:ABC transporter transmembrane domain-containing protein [Actinomyces trachealis]